MKYLISWWHTYGVGGLLMVIACGRWKCQLPLRSIRVAGSIQWRSLISITHLSVITHSLRTVGIHSGGSGMLGRCPNRHVSARECLPVVGSLVVLIGPSLRGSSWLLVPVVVCWVAITLRYSPLHCKHTKYIQYNMLLYGNAKGPV